jgi:hypothetical protein
LDTSSIPLSPKGEEANREMVASHKESINHKNAKTFVILSYKGFVLHQKCQIDQKFYSVSDHEMNIKILYKIFA